MLTSLFKRLRSSFETIAIAGPDLQRLAFRLAPLVVLSLIVYWLVPRFSFRDSGSLSVVAQLQVRQFVQDVTASVNEATDQPTRPDSGPVEATPTRAAFRPTCIYCTDYLRLTVPLTPLVSVLVKVPVQVYGGRYLSSVSNPEYYPMVRADNVVLMFLILVGVALGVRAVRVPAVRGRFRLTTDHASTPLPSNMTAEEFLESDVERAEERARDVYRRSTILLGGGIVMAFVGVALFYVTLPSSSPVQAEAEFQRERYYHDIERELYYRQRNDVSSSREGLLSPQAREEHPWLLFASHSLRPTGMLIFMEGIAWFLLRQYRVLIEEYKSFLRVYLKRSSYLIAWKAAASSGVERQFSIAQAMISDDVGGTLKRDETTEALETLKMAEPPPIIEVLREVKALIPTLNKRWPR